MHPLVRKFFPFVVIAVGLLAVVWAVTFGTLPEPEFAFVNGTDIKTVDPAKVTGAPEGRVINGLFEGLYRIEPVGVEFDDDGNVVKWPQPDAAGNVPVKPQPAIAESCDTSADGKTYTFAIRDGTLWSDGSPITAHDFEWSWRRTLHPETASQYAYQLHYVAGAERYNSARVDVGDRVEVELADRPKQDQTFPRGTMRYGVLRQIARPPKPDFERIKDQDEREDKQAEWKKKWVFVVEVKPARDGKVDWQAPGKLQAFTKNDKLPDSLDGLIVQRERNESETAAGAAGGSQQLSQVQFDGELQRCMQVLFDFDSQVGIKATNDHTLIVKLKNPTPYFLDLVAFYPLYPVNRACVEQFGSPNWTKPENIVSNGPFRLEFRRIRDRVRMVKNEHYWNAKVVHVSSIDALAVESSTTALNMYLDGQSDWILDVPPHLVPKLHRRDDFVTAPLLGTYFYRLNVTKPPLDDVHVRRALNMAVNKQIICERIVKAGQRPARSFVPTYLSNYSASLCAAFDPEKAKAELAKSKYVREGKRIPKIEILYNTQESHRAIAEVIQQQWKNYLGIDVGLVNLEWQSYLAATRAMQYSVARAGWIGDYPDPNTFLDMWVSEGENNETGWSNPRYDKLIADAAAETDPEQRLRLMQQAERILMDEQPIIPIYFYVSMNMVKPRVEGFFGNIQDLHPLHLLRVE